MKKLALGALFVGLAAACGGDDGPPIVVTDGGADATPPGACSPTLQTGCDAGEKCTWIVDSDEPEIAHVGCAADGTIEQFGTCNRATAAGGGVDDCVAGTVCLGGMCKPICDTNGGEPPCPTNYACVRYADFLEDGGGNSVGGVCEPGCDPLTQKMLIGGAEACGSADPTAPTLGCYGIDDFSCSRAGDLTKTDRVDAAENGTVYLNSCAPGYLPLWPKSATDSTVICSGLCAPLPIDNTQPDPIANRDGDNDALAKLPTQTMARVGDAVCSSARKGSAGGNTCLYMWPTAEDDQGNIPASFEPYVDTLGFCFDITQYPSDIDMDGDQDPWGDCTMLPPVAPGDPNDPNYNPSLGASFWWCQPRGSALTGAQTKRARMDIGFALDEVELRRHVLR